MIFFDTEGVGVTGPLVLIQWAGGKGCEIALHEAMLCPVRDTLQLIEAMADTEVVGFNLVHDWFQLVKWYNVFRRLPDCGGSPMDQLADLKRLEALGPLRGDRCLKPLRACDLMLLARTGRFQYLAKHRDVVVKKVPVQMATPVVEALGAHVGLPQGVKLTWRQTQKLRDQGRKDVVDLTGRFEGLSTSLKHLYSVVTGEPQTGSFEEEVHPPPYKDMPDWMPWGGEWTWAVQKLVRIFREDQRAVDYAVRDVHYTYRLWQALDSPAGGDDDSELACCVGASHWCGFALAPRERIEQVVRKYHEQQQEFLACNSRDAVMQTLGNYLSDTEKLILTDAKRTTLEEFARWDGHAVQPVAKKILRAKQGSARNGTLRKLHRAGIFCFSMKVGGTLSSRMSGGADQGEGGMNAQGIPRDNEVRELFPLAFAPDEHLEGGDFDAFEVSIADAVYKDRQLAEDIRSDKKFHAITGSVFYRRDYQDVLASKGTGPQTDLYVRSKNGFFAWLYRCLAKKLAKVMDITVEEAEVGIARWAARYGGIHEHHKLLEVRFSPIWQEGGAGSKIHWREPDEYVESILGFRRYFTLEWAVVRSLYKLQDDLPHSWLSVKGECRRTDRCQTMAGAARSAMFGAMFSVASSAYRAAANHEIQSPGGQITKAVQRRIWDRQPCGVGPWVVRPMNVHDEILSPTTLQEGVLARVVDDVVAEYRADVPCLKMGWGPMKNWSEK